MGESANNKAICNAAKIAQRLILELHASNPQNETFAQFGLLDGEEIVIDYLEHNEWGLALQHLLYMIHESDIQFPREVMLQLHGIAKSYGIENHYSKENQPILIEKGITIFNAP